MGDKSLMKKSITLKVSMLMILNTTLLLCGSLSSEEIVKMVSEIKKERKGISLATLENTGKPFIIREPKKKEKPSEVKKVAKVVRVEEIHTLKAILNKAAFIDGKWYKQGEKVGSYRVQKVSLDSVVLKNSYGTKKLSLKKRKKNFIKLNRGYR
jgi:hypothetical protein